MTMSTDTETTPTPIEILSWYTLCTSKDPTALVRTDEPAVKRCREELAAAHPGAGLDRHDAGMAIGVAARLAVRWAQASKASRGMARRLAEALVRDYAAAEPHVYGLVLTETDAIWARALS